MERLTITNIDKVIDRCIWGHRMGSKYAVFSFHGENNSMYVFNTKVYIYSDTYNITHSLRRAFDKKENGFMFMSIPEKGNSSWEIVTPEIISDWKRFFDTVLSNVIRLHIKPYDK